MARRKVKNGGKSRLAPTIYPGRVSEDGFRVAVTLSLPTTKEETEQKLPTTQANVYLL